MSQKLYIGNLPYRTTENDVRALFAKYEPIYSTVLIADRETGRSRGFGFIELEKTNAEAAITELGNTIYGGRTLRISRAKNRESISVDLRQSSCEKAA
ncbi:MAG: RNA-binding protein [Chitinispirillales bacterium]|jgi:RNA recognition motif-containing protein|nr:RNA-binding protein [Chitinispirillales bacterium]